MSEAAPAGLFAEENEATRALRAVLWVGRDEVPPDRWIVRKVRYTALRMGVHLGPLAQTGARASISIWPAARIADLWDGGTEGLPYALAGPLVVFRGGPHTLLIDGHRRRRLIVAQRVPWPVIVLRIPPRRIRRPRPRE